MEVSELRNATKGKELHLLDMMVKTSVPEREEVIVDHAIHPLDQDLIHVLQKVVTRGIPLLDRYLDESLGDNIQGVTREFPRPRPVKLSQIRGQLHSGVGASHSSAMAIT